MWGYLFILFLVASGIFDLRHRMVPNWLIFCGLITSIFVFVFDPENQPFGVSRLNGLISSISIFLFFLLFYFMGLMGAGDVKFSAALGAWVGWELLFLSWALSCAFALAHGLIARSDLRYLFFPAIKLENGSTDRGKRFIPYVTYLSLATVIVLVMIK
ncbi:A24 family peptidase [Comamonas sp. PE63]|nr:A24 family peptidase [Comamonas sp. PE63]